MVGGCQGSKVQKICFEVFGGGKKLWCQKGIGCVCVGIICSFIWCGGGIIFVVKLCSYEQKLNKKMYCVVLCFIFVEFVCLDCLVVVVDFVVDVLKIKGLVVKLDILGLKDVLIVIDGVDENLYFVVCNLVYVDVCDV